MVKYRERQSRVKGETSMIPAKMDSISTATIREKGIESVVDWFELHQESFYPLGYLYLRDQQQMEELFYRSIVKVHKELPRYKSDTSFEIWVSSIFIEICRELSHDSDVQASGENQDLFHALGQLADGEKEAMLLTYVKGFTHEEAADILRISTDKMKDLLVSGIQSVRKQLSGSTYHGCKEYQKNYLDYLEKSMERPEKIEFEKHLYHCQECQADLASFQDVTFTLIDFSKRLNELPAMTPFMENVKKRLTEKEKHRQLKTKKRIRLGLAFASVFAVVIGIVFITGAFNYAYYGWTEEDEQLRAFLQQDLGKRMNLEAESDGVKVKITGVIADDVQTLVFYKIEDTEDDNKYFMNYEDGLYVENENEVLSQVTYPRYYMPDLKAEMNKKEKNVFYGKVGLRPLQKDTDTVKLQISKLMKMIPDSNESMGFYTGNIEYKSGEWNFEVPVSKQPSIEYELNEETEIEGIPFRFHKLTIAPTATILDYGIFIGQPEKRIDYVEFGDLEVNNKKVKADRFGGGFTTSYQDVNWNSFKTQFDPLFGEKPTEVTLQLKTAYFTVEDNKSIELDVTQTYPQTFEYAGSTISIDKVEVGQPTTVVFSDHEIKNRAYETLHVNIVGENENEPMSMEMESEGVFVDRNGVEYDPNGGFFDFGKIEQPRHFITEQTFKLNGNKIIPKRIEIFGYNTTKYLDETVKIRLE
jgi:DNA-directed RNA polymerase specialized sigma24 family protein